jgi:hypothetical protein
MFSVKSLMRSAGAVGGALVLLASGASAAVAAPLFSTTGAVGFATSTAGPVKLSWGGGAPWQKRTCVPGVVPATGSTANTGGQAYITGFTFPQGSLTCTDVLGATFQTIITLSGPANVNNVGGTYWAISPHLKISDAGPAGTGLVATSTAVQFPARFTNGTTGLTGANPSTWTFANTLVGYVVDTRYDLSLLPIRLTGTFKTGTAAPLTVSG